MIRCDLTFEIARPLPEVFAYVDDVRNAPKWLGRCRGLEQTSSGPKGVGSTLRYQYFENRRDGEMTGMVSEYEVNRRLVMKYSDAMFDVEVGFGFESASPGTRIAHTVRIEPRNLMFKLMQPMIEVATKKQLATDTAKLKQLLETPA